MYFDDHNPPHFHALYAGNEVEINIATLDVTQGRIPKRALGMVLEWAAIHQLDLQANWNRLHSDQPAEKIAPLD
jgi:hypothetical protein